METNSAVRAFAALAHEARLDVFRLLVEAGSDGLAAGAIAERLEIPAATLSFHLKELRNAGVIGCVADGRQRIYSPNFAAMRELMAFLTENCCRGIALAATKKGAAA